MESIILKNSVAEECKKFLNMALGKVKANESYARNTLLTLIINYGTPVLSQLAKMREINPTVKTIINGKEVKTIASRKGIGERFSRWLSSYDFNPQDFLFKNAKKEIDRHPNIAFDASDISKEFGGDGMEGMEPGRDGSRHTTAKGHAVIAASIVPKGRKDAIPLVVKVHRGHKGVQKEEQKIIKQIFDATNGKGQLVMDRGYDNAEMVYFLSTNKYKAVIRINEARDRDVFANSFDVAKNFNYVKRFNTTLERAKEKMIEASIAYKIGCYPCENTSFHCNNYYAPIMVVSSRFDDKEIFLYVIRESFENMKEKELKNLAIDAAQAYLDRWSIETMFLRIKQDYKIEDVRVLKFKKLENLVALATLAYYFTAHYLKEKTETYRKIVKTIKDTFNQMVGSVHSFLFNMRELFSYQKVSFISGRPRKKIPPNNFQLELDFDF